MASWALGAGPADISSGYEKDCGYEKPAIKSPQPITFDNFADRLGDDRYVATYLFPTYACQRKSRYYSGYVKFFTEFVEQHGIPRTLEQYLFSPEANIGTSEKQPWMLARFLSGVLHPIIHVGYGAEFGLPGMIVEGELSYQ